MKLPRTHLPADAESPQSCTHQAQTIPIDQPAMDPKAGYVYAVPVGYRSIDGYDAPPALESLRLHVKIGSVRTPDPVAALKHAYSRALGQPEVWWLAPSADAYRDEMHDVHVVLAARRVWPNREVFAFDNKAECLAVLAEVAEGLQQRTAGEVKPPAVTDLVNAWLPQQQAAEERAQKKAKREQDKAQQQEQRRTRAVAQADDLQHFITQQCVLGPTSTVECSLFRQRAPCISGGLKAALQRMGFPMAKKGPKGGQRWCFVGLRLT